MSKKKLLSLIAVLVAALILVPALQVSATHTSEVAWSIPATSSNFAGATGVILNAVVKNVTPVSNPAAVKTVKITFSTNAATGFNTPAAGTCPTGWTGSVASNVVTYTATGAGIAADGSTATFAPVVTNPTTASTSVAVPVTVTTDVTASVAATLPWSSATDWVGYTALTAGDTGNAFEIIVVNPGILHALTADYASGTDTVTITLAHDGGSVTSTASKVATHITTNSASLHVTAGVASGKGAVVMTAMGSTPLSGGITAEVEGSCTATPATVLTVVAVPDTIYVDAVNGSDANSGESAAMALATIGKALTIVQAGGTISVASGTYRPTAALYITKARVTIKGANYGVNPITGTRAAESIIDASLISVSMGAIYTDYDNVTVDGFTVDGSLGDAIVIYPCITSSTEGVAVRNNIISDAGSSGIVIAKEHPSYAGYVVAEATISGNVLTDCVGEGIVLLDGAKDITVSGNKITGCESASGAAIHLRGGSTYKTQGNKITENTVTDNDGWGIRLSQMTAARPNLDNNLIEGNKVSSNTEDGIAIGLNAVVTKLTITNNNITDNGSDGIEIGNTGNWGVGNTINNNNIYGNISCGIESATGLGPVDAKSNWWGDASGPFVSGENPDGKGDTIHQGGGTTDIKYTPWLTSAYAPPGATLDTWGVFRNGAWYLDITGDGDATDTYETFNFGHSDGVPLVGDWSATGTATWGVFRNGVWYLDKNGDHSAAAPDEEFYFGNPTDTPLVGDWNGDDTDTWGVFRDGAWFLDHDGDGTADEAFNFGNATDTPLVGDWNGDGTDTCGVFRDGAWFLDKNGDYDAADVGEAFYFGNATDTPLVGDWGGTAGTDTCGVWRAGAWFLDINGDNDAADTGEAFYFGLSTDTPLVGNWGSGSAAPTQAASASAAGWYAMCFPNPASTGDAVTFRMMGAGVNAVQVSIYDLGGGLVYQSNFETGRSLTWDLYSEGAPVANGIYLYSMIAKANGELIETEIGKLLILR